jgi:hypothetical protein
MKNIWVTREDLIEALRTPFNTTIELYSNPLDKSLGSHTYHSLYPEDLLLSSSNNNATFAWQGTNKYY